MNAIRKTFLLKRSLDWLVEGECRMFLKMFSTGLRVGLFLGCNVHDVQPWRSLYVNDEINLLLLEQNIMSTHFFSMGSYTKKRTFYSALVVSLLIFIFSSKNFI